MPGRKEVRGAASALTLAGNITNVAGSCTVNGSVTGWPTGASYPFIIAIDRGLANEEKILCSSLSGSGPATINFTTRGYDGTSGVAHNSPAIVEHVIDADTIDSLFAHNFDTTRDDHTQYIKTDGSRAFTALTSIVGTPVSIGTANASGSALTLVRSDHVHQVGVAAINNANMFASGVVNAAAIGADAVGASEIASNSVTYDEMDTSVIRPVTVCTSGTRPTSPAPVAGDFIFETDTGKTYVRFGGAWRDVTGAAGWEAFTPTITGGLTLGNGTITGSYQKSGRIVHFRIMFTFGSTSSWTGQPLIALPVSRAGTERDTFPCHAWDTSASQYFPGFAIATVSDGGRLTDIYIVSGLGTARVSSSNPMTWATGDILAISGSYEALL